MIAPMILDFHFQAILQLNSKLEKFSMLFQVQVKIL
jgi:hypothetical protein